MLISHRSLKFPERIPLRLSLKTILRLMPAQQIRRSWLALFLALIACVFSLLVGCKAGSDKFVKGGDTAVFDPAANKTGQKTLKKEPIKSAGSEGQHPERAETPTQPGKADKSKVAEYKAAAPANPVEPPVSPPPSPPKPMTGLRQKTKVTGKRNKISEVEEIKQAALNIAKNIDTIAKIRICHVENEDEWWVTLYDDIGPVIDLKQYVWDRDSETLRPFLVLKRISQARFQAQLTAKEPDRRCEVIDPPPKPSRKKTQDEKKAKAF